MYPALSDAALSAGTSLPDFLDAAEGGGFAGVTLSVGPGGLLGPGIRDEEIQGIGMAARAAGLRVAGLRLESGLSAGLIATEAARRGAVIDQIRQWLRHSRLVGSGGLMLPPPRMGNGEQWQLLRESLLELRFDGEAEGVELLIEVDGGAAHEVVVAWRDFLDELTTAWVAACVLVRVEDSSARRIEGNIRLLGKRIRGVCITCGGAMAAAEPSGIEDVGVGLEEVGYEGPITIEERALPVGVIGWLGRRP